MRATLMQLRVGEMLAILACLVVLVVGIVWYCLSSLLPIAVLVFIWNQAGQPQPELVDSGVSLPPLLVLIGLPVVAIVSALAAWLWRMNYR
jgi:hypothetical protein